MSALLLACRLACLLVRVCICVCISDFMCLFASVSVCLCLFVSDRLSLSVSLSVRGMNRSAQCEQCVTFAYFVLLGCALKPKTAQLAQPLFARPRSDEIPPLRPSGAHCNVDRGDHTGALRILLAQRTTHATARKGHAVPRTAARGSIPPIDDGRVPGDLADGQASTAGQVSGVRPHELGTGRLGAKRPTLPPALKWAEDQVEAGICREQALEFTGFGGEEGSGLCSYLFTFVAVEPCTLMQASDQNALEA